MGTAHPTKNTYFHHVILSSLVGWAMPTVIMAEVKTNPELLEQQAETILLLKEQIQEVKDENSRLKKQKPKPKIKPSKLL
ncbi:MAG: hypothetical protein U9O82_09420, partial [Thermodesulfobacteriota bacterium]|nr:hypothetical protein [Thermodesulfobacteriota bacterium]